jgi:hypothetical protein
MVCKPIVPGNLYSVDGVILQASHPCDAISAYIEVMIKSGIWS